MAGVKSEVLPFEVAARHAGESSWGWLHLLRYSIRNLKQKQPYWLMAGRVFLWLRLNNLRLWVSKCRFYYFCFGVAHVLPLY